MRRPNSTGSSAPILGLVAERFAKFTQLTHQLHSKYRLRYMTTMSCGPQTGCLIIEGGNPSRAILKRFVALAGGPEAKIVYLPTGASAVKGRSGVIVNPDWPRDRPEWSSYRADLCDEFGLERITILHTRDRRVADTEAFVAPLRSATGVWLGPGNAGRYAAAYLDTLTHRELEGVLARGGVIGGTSAGAIILGSFTVRGRPDKPLLMARGHERGFGFLQHVAINPHLLTAKRENELVDVVDAHPELLGIGIDENTALIVQGNTFEVFGESKVAIYDNRPHDGLWYYWLRPGDRFDLRARTPCTGQVSMRDTVAAGQHEPCGDCLSGTATSTSTTSPALFSGWRRGAARGEAYTPARRTPNGVLSRPSDIHRLLGTKNGNHRCTQRHTEGPGRSRAAAAPMGRSCEAL